MRTQPFLQRHAIVLSLLSIVLCVLCAYAVRSLKVYSDFKRMLPQNYPSVRALERIEARVQSTSTLHVLIGSDDWPATKRYIDDFVVAVQTQLPGVIDRVEYNATTAQQFFERHKYLFISLPDLRTVRDRLQQRIDFEKFRRTPFAIELTAPPSLDFSDIEERYTQQAIRATTFRDGYFTNANASLAVVILKPTQGATDAAYAKQLIEQVRAVAQSLHPEHYHPSLQVGFGGRYQKVGDEFDTIVGDMFITLALCAVLVGGIVWYYFRRFRMVILMIGAAGLGTMVALASARVIIGYLTAQTAFLGSIILGNGINYSLIVMARYLEERRRGLVHDNAFAECLAGTWRPTLASAGTTMVGFAALSITNIRGLSQFAFIGSVGMLTCWLMTYTFLPAWLHLSERIWPLPYRPDDKARQPFQGFMLRISRLIQDKPQRVLRVAGVLTAASAIGVLLYLPNALEYDSDKLRFRPPTVDTWESRARDGTRAIFGQSPSPSVIVLDRLDQAQAVCGAIEAKAATVVTGAGKPMLEQCKTLFSYVPAEQPEKLLLLQEIRALVDSVSDAALTEYQARVDELRATDQLRLISADDLPQSLREAFRERDGEEGLIAYVYPTEEANLWDGRELVKFATLLRSITLPSGETIHSSGELVVFADLLYAVAHEGPRVVISSFALVMLVIWLAFRRQRHAAPVLMITLAVGILWMLAVFPLFGVKLNFVNFVVLPITFGIGIDYAVNIYGRYAQEGEGSIRHVLTHVGGAVLLCSITTIIGYAVLLLSHNLAVVSLGMSALLGEITCLLAAVVVMPAYFQWREQRMKKTEARNDHTRTHPSTAQNGFARPS